MRLLFFRFEYAKYFEYSTYDQAHLRLRHQYRTFGVTSGIYAAIRLAGPLISNTKGAVGLVPSYLDAKTFLFVATGFFMLYCAALLH